MRIEIKKAIVPRGYQAGVSIPDSTSAHVLALRDAQSVHDFMEDWGNRVLAALLIERSWNAKTQHHHPDVHELRRAQDVRRKHQEDDDL